MISSDEIDRLIRLGESSLVQFKENITNEKSIAQEIVAFANTCGGQILIGVNDKTWEISGLTRDDLRRLTNLLVNAVVWLKNGANKRKVTSNEELARLLQISGYIYAEEQVLPQSDISDIHKVKFLDFFESLYKESPEPDQLEMHLNTLRLASGSKINIAGALLFGKNLRKLTPDFFITAIWFYGNSLTEDQYRSSENIYGTLEELYRKGFDFILAKLNKIQAPGQTFNSLGEPEIPEQVITELLINAIIHRDYFIRDSIKIFLFENRIEIISPGTLPNNLTPNQVKMGIRRTRNTLIASFAPHIMQYRGAGSGILRSLELYPHFDILNDVENERVVITIQRPQLR